MLYESLKLLADLRDLAETNDDIAGTLASQNARLSENILALLLKETGECSVLIEYGNKITALNINIFGMFVGFKDGKVSKPRAEYEELLSQLAESTPDSLLSKKRPVTEVSTCKIDSC